VFTAHRRHVRATGSRDERLLLATVAIEQFPLSCSGVELLAVTAPRRIVIQPYIEQWPSEFAVVRDLLREALGDVADRIDHIGSTSVPGLAAKDVIDVQVGVADLEDRRLVPAFERLGATATDITSDHVPPGDQSGPVAWEKRYFRPPASWRATHLHVRETGRPNFRYALLFRDYLRHSAVAAGAYAQVKVALARLHPDDAEAYYDVKDPVCDLIMDAAEQWAAGVGWSA
jgi:GrpB-like predicted nucleotidyltransferase (UPF0157 family)